MLEMDATMLLMNPAPAYYQPRIPRAPAFLRSSLFDPLEFEVSLRHESAGNNRANERLSRIRRRILDLPGDIRRCAIVPIGR